jgi:hypothetical protein
MEILYRQNIYMQQQKKIMNQMIISSLLNIDKNLQNNETRFYLGLYKGKGLWLSVVCPYDADNYLETALFEGDEKPQKLVYYNELGYYDIKRFYSPNNQNFSKEHFNEIYTEICNLKNLISIENIPTQ